MSAFGSRRILFTADDGVNGRELWQSDGTRMLGPIAPGFSAPAITTLHVRNDGMLLFRADDGLHGAELYTYDPGALGRAIGSKCGAAVLPRLRIEDPVLGASARGEITNRVAGNAGALVLGVPGYSALGSGCALHVDVAGPLVAVAVPMPAGSVVLGLSIPNNAALAGGVLNAQVLAGPTANPPFLLDLSNAIALRLGR